MAAVAMIVPATVATFLWEELALGELLFNLAAPITQKDRVYPVECKGNVLSQSIYCGKLWLQEEPGKVELCKGTIQRAEDGEVLIVTSALTIAEVLWRKGGPRSSGTTASSQKMRSMWQLL